MSYATANVGNYFPFAFSRSMRLTKRQRPLDEATFAGGLLVVESGRIAHLVDLLTGQNSGPSALTGGTRTRPPHRQAKLNEPANGF
jgi:hypothetical protein